MHHLHVQEAWDRALKYLEKKVVDSTLVFLSASKVVGQKNGIVTVEMPPAFFLQGPDHVSECRVIAQDILRVLADPTWQLDLVPSPPGADPAPVAPRASASAPVEKTSTRTAASSGRRRKQAPPPEMPLPATSEPIREVVRGKAAGRSKVTGPKTTTQPRLPFDDVPGALPAPVEDTLPPPEEEIQNDPFNANYTFSSFVVGKTNRFAHAASLRAAQTPAKSYNPLVLCGGVGLGKTHLMHAIAQYVLATKKGKYKVLYISSEKFMNDFIETILQNEPPGRFRAKYRNVDILLVDDIQFLARKEQTQEEFFHTFNALHNANKQIVLSTDRPPHAISALEARLRSRFASGLLVEIEPPDYETRLAILRRKAQAEQEVQIGEGAIECIAERVDSNIRELEGTWTRLVAYAQMNDQPLSADLAISTLGRILPGIRSSSTSIEEIQKVICTYYGLTSAELLGKKRTKLISFPRQIAMYISREFTDHSLLEIGQAFGGRNHATVVHAHEKISRLIAADEQMGSIIQSLYDRLARN